MDYFLVHFIDTESCNNIAQRWSKCKICYTDTIDCLFHNFSDNETVIRPLLFWKRWYLKTMISEFSYTPCSVTMVWKTVFLL